MLENFWKKENNFENINPQYKALLTLLMIVLFICFVALSSNLFEQNKKRLEMELDLEYNDVVIEKGRDKNNRNNPYLILSKTNLYHEDSIIWAKIDVGDSLIKQKKSSLLKVIKKDTVIILDYKDVYKYWDNIYRNER
ncbi:hypothetical protein FLJC2902T_32280 [Flavobacterium limnosediminis JC2902]|uniref:Uncharacterized protein n=1 Tax=Flavobacterium limnosediminis JC2902 TaxID=1341181 RepID=V6S9E6_9FLAO|nr:hypothetical protein [Flavobacterium limnosediminis]ESU23064.1 hypothetical protein FLJC2902T_32280 [Flavobacterium limnosediminis JC2902]